MYDGVLVPVSQLLGPSFKSRFISRYCIPLFGDAGVDGFDCAPASQAVPGQAVLRADFDGSITPHASVPEYPVYSRGQYRLKYVLEPRVAAHPNAFVQRVNRDGPYDIRNMWSTRSFHHSVL